MVYDGIIAAFKCTRNKNQSICVANTTVLACSRSGASSLKASGTERLSTGMTEKESVNFRHTTQMPPNSGDLAISA